MNNNNPLSDNRNLLTLSLSSHTSLDHWDKSGRKKMIILSEEQALDNPIQFETTSTAARRNFITLVSLLAQFRRLNPHISQLRQTFLEMTFMLALIKQMADKTSACQNGVNPYMICFSVMETSTELQHLSLDDAIKSLKNLSYETYGDTQNGIHLEKESIEPTVQYFLNPSNFNMSESIGYPIFLDKWAIEITKEIKTEPMDIEDDKPVDTDPENSTADSISRTFDSTSSISQDFDDLF